ncbi:DNA cytosine methyltransferase [Methylorubrum populi]|uniref:DNA cytosine methyltransferase n=1 Tax=Methylorubrum populi TaxID=223967 RepID=UPI0012FFBF14|nr:DNA cytosine methyltransferase [Methylorubrum populi]
MLDLFSCIGCHAIGFHRAGFQTAAFVEANPVRRDVLARRFPGIPIHDDVRTYAGQRGEADIIVGGPPCQGTSVAAAVHGYRTGTTLWPDMLRICLDVRPEWVVVEQPPGNARWEADVAGDLAGAGYHTARLEFEARNVGAPFERRRVFILASSSLPRLEIAWSAGPSEIERVARAADARGAWNPSVLRALRVDARSAGEMERSESRLRRERIEALGDSNPPEMMEVVAGCIARAILAPSDAPTAPDRKDLSGQNVSLSISEGQSANGGATGTERSVPTPGGLAEGGAVLKVSAEQVLAARTPQGGWTKAQLAAWGVPWPPPKGWRERLTADEPRTLSPVNPPAKEA